MDKEVEQYLLDRLQKKHPEIFDLPYAATEEPDFVAVHLGRRIGLELARFPGDQTKKPVNRARETFLDRVRDKCVTLSEEAGADGIYVSVFTDLAHISDLKEHEKVAEELWHFAESHIPDEGDSVGFTPGLDCKPFNTIKVHRINVAKLQGASLIHWGFPLSGWVPELSPQEIQGVIDAKELKIPAYLRKCDEVSLLVSLDQLGLGSFRDVTGSVTDAVFETGFAQVYLFASLPGRLYELTTSSISP